MSIAIILGSARDRGNTHLLADEVANDANATVFNLSDYQISAYDYEHKNRVDDFLPLMKEILRFDRIVLASPIYWYAPSSIMKVFLDRLSDLITIEKDLGRTLREKTGAIISTGCDAEPPACFEEVFKRTYQYLGVDYRGMLYCPCEDNLDIHEHRSMIDSFVRSLHAQ